MRFTLFIALFLVLPFVNHSYAQNRANPVYIEVDRNSRGEPTFYAVNQTQIPYTLEIEFYDMRGLAPVTPNPYLVTSEPGRRRIIQLKKFGLSDGGISYRYRYSMSMGCHRTKPDEDVEYLLPLAPGKTTSAFELSYLGEMVDQQGPDGFYSLGFHADGGDTVFASRSGRVSRIRNEYDDSKLNQVYTSNTNYVEIVHKDCTFATYKLLKKDSFMVGEGDEVEAGQALGLISSNPSESQEHLRFNVYYRNPDSDEREQPNKYWSYLTPKFRTRNYKNVRLTPNKEYSTIHPAEVITQEMNRRERRRWMRNQNN